MPFDSKTVLKEQVALHKLRCYSVSYDLGKVRYDSFSEILMDALVDFAFGFHTGILKQYDRRKLKEAARCIYRIKEYSDVKSLYVDKDDEIRDCELKVEDKYLKKGEFGELILHVLLRDFLNTIPLLSKIHFKDTDGETVHGFDLVHIGPDMADTSKESLYLGESKLYYRKDGTAGKSGIEELIEDVKSHFKIDFLQREIAIIGKKNNAFLELDSYPDANTKDEYMNFLDVKDRWFEKLKLVEQQKLKMQDFLSCVTVPLVCTYQSKIFETCADDSVPEFREKFQNETDELFKIFETKLKEVEASLGSAISTRLNIVLILFPVPSKKDLIKILHKKLYNQQNA